MDNDDLAIRGSKGFYGVHVVENALDSLHEKADKIASDAAHGGMVIDNGAAKIRDSASAYLKGLNREVPEWLEREILELRKTEDNERKEYERLKAKYGGTT